MTDDPLSRLRQQLVRAAILQSDASAANLRHRWKRPALWASLAVGLIGVPAVATAAGVIQLTSNDRAADGSAYAVERIQDDQSAADPSVKDGIGRNCDTVKVTDTSGTTRPATIACGPKDAASAGPISGGFSVTHSQELFIYGSTASQATKVEILGLDRSVQLSAPTTDGRKSYRAVVPLGKYTLVAYDDGGAELGRTKAGM